MVSLLSALLPAMPAAGLTPAAKGVGDDAPAVDFGALLTVVPDAPVISPGIPAPRAGGSAAAPDDLAALLPGNPTGDGRQPLAAIGTGLPPVAVASRPPSSRPLETISSAPPSVSPRAMLMAQLAPQPVMPTAAAILVDPLVSPPPVSPPILGENAAPARPATEASDPEGIVGEERPTPIHPTPKPSSSSATLVQPGIVRGSSLRSIAARGDAGADPDPTSPATDDGPERPRDHDGTRASTSAAAPPPPAPATVVEGLAPVTPASTDAGTHRSTDMRAPSMAAGVSMAETSVVPPSATPAGRGIEGAPRPATMVEGAARDGSTPSRSSTGRDTNDPPAPPGLTAIEPAPTRPRAEGHASARSPRDPTVSEQSTASTRLSATADSRGLVPGDGEVLPQAFAELARPTPESVDAAMVPADRSPPVGVSAAAGPVARSTPDLAAIASAPPAGAPASWRLRPGGAPTVEAATGRDTPAPMSTQPLSASGPTIGRAMMGAAIFAQGNASSSLRTAPPGLASTIRVMETSAAPAAASLPAPILPAGDGAPAVPLSTTPGTAPAAPPVTATPTAAIPNVPATATSVNPPRGASSSPLPVASTDPSRPPTADADTPARETVAVRAEPAFRAFAAAMFDAAGTTLAAPSAAPIADPRPIDLTQPYWPHAMVDRIERLRDEASLGDTRIRLIPDALGTIDVALRRDGETVHVTFHAEQAETGRLLAEARPELTALAETRGIKLADPAPAPTTGGWANSQAGSNQAFAGSDRAPRQQHQPSTPAASPRAAPAAGEPSDDTRIA